MSDCLKYLNLVYIAVVPMEEDMTISGLSDILESGTTVKLTCTVQRIRPEASEMFWIIDGRRIDETIHTSLNQDIASLKQYNTISRYLFGVFYTIEYFRN